MSTKINERNNFALLTSALILLLVGVAVADQLDLHLGQLVLQVGLVMALALGVWSIRTEIHCAFCTPTPSTSKPCSPPKPVSVNRHAP